MSTIKFRMVAYTGAAGKYDPTAPMNGNEDNFYVDDNLSDDLPSHCEQDIVQDLDKYGLIMAVADGMGGMNAGEVASEIAVNTVRDFFAPGKITAELASSPAKRMQYMEALVVEADKRIKEDAKVNREHDGMGSTIILAWIVGDKMTVTWCGDSRAYRFNPQMGIEPLSEDHSYVQDLVKQGVLTYDDTFEHPQGNIITRSLGERGKVSQPETRQFELYNSDIILLCSDGLSGVLRDKKTKDPDGNYYSGENIEDLIRNNSSSMKVCKDALWDAAERADWYDNVTILLCEILDGAKQLTPAVAAEMTTERNNNGKPIRGFWSQSLNIKVRPKFFIVTLCLLLVLAGGLWLLVNVNDLHKQEAKDADGEEYVDTCRMTTTNELQQAKDKIQSVLLQYCRDYMELSGKEIKDVQGYLELEDKINDATSIEALSELSNAIKEFKQAVARQTEQIKEIDSLLKDSEGSKKFALKTLRDKCVESPMSDDAFKKELEKIKKMGSKVPNPPKPDNLVPAQENATQVSTEQSTNDSELTPSSDEYWCDYTAPAEEANIKEDFTVFLKNKTPEGYIYDGLYDENKNFVQFPIKTNGHYKLRFVRKFIMTP